MIDKEYPSGLGDEEWELIKELLLKEEGSSSGRLREVDLRKVWCETRSTTSIRPGVNRPICAQFSAARYGEPPLYEMDKIRIFSAGER